MSLKSKMNDLAPSASNIWDSTMCINSAVLNLSLNNKVPHIGELDDVDDDEDDIEVELDEKEQLYLQKVSSLVDAAYRRVEKINKEQLYKVPYPEGSEESSCASTLPVVASLPESIYDGRAEIEELKNLPVNFESALHLNQILQRRLNVTLQRLEKTLEQNLLRQVQLKEEAEHQGLMNPQDKEYRESRDKYYARPSSFAIPYFKDRTGMPAPMNNDAKFKVEKGYLDLYSTRLRTWLVSEQNTLLKEVQKEWKNHLVSDWTDSLKSVEWKLKKELNLEKKKELEEKINSYKARISFFTNVAADKIDIPLGAKIDWDKVSAQAFDGYRTTEECQLLWENYLHPTINKSPWSEKEDVTIQESIMAQEENKPDWEALAKMLGTGRTPFQVMQRWVSYIKPTIHPARWTPEASKKLENTISMLRVGTHIPWAQVARHLTGYTKLQIQSRWRIINPEVSKGPFTSEEDFILLKGLYKLGMNFDVIAHFLPGRTRVQVRDRFKRAILPGLTWKPWTWQEDKKIIANCSMDAQHWRRMAMLLPTRDSCQIRLRFYILLFWQSISIDNKLPPPLFPLSMTSNPVEIKNLRDKMVDLSPEVRVYLDSLEANKDVSDLLLDKSVRSFEERRASIVKKKDRESLAKFLKEKEEEVPRPLPLRKKRRGKAGPRTPSWPDKALTEFFLPARAPLFNPIDLEDETAMQHHLHNLGQALQIRIKTSVSTDAVMRLQQDLININETDLNIINEIFIDHHNIEDYGDECVACFNQNPQVIPFMPPNFSIIGAFKSLKLHKPKLEEMAFKDFLLFQVPRSQLHKLGTIPKTLREQTVSNEVVKYEEVVSKRGKKRKAAAIANFVNYVYSKENTQQTLLRNPVLKKEVFEPVPEEDLVQMQIEGEHSSFRNYWVGDSTRKEVIELEDSLLFHRFLSLFFWPALLNTFAPTKKNLYLSSELAKEAKLRKLNIPDSISETGITTQRKSHLTCLDVEEQEKLVQTMEAVRNRKISEHKRLFCKLDGTLKPEDMKKRIFKKNIVKLKRSVIMKKSWEKKRLGIPAKQSKEKELKPSTRPKSKRIASRQSLKGIIQDEGGFDENQLDEYEAMIKREI